MVIKLEDGFVTIRIGRRDVEGLSRQFRYLFRFYLSVSGFSEVVYIALCFPFHIRALLVFGCIWCLYSEFSDFAAVDDKYTLRLWVS